MGRKATAPAPAGSIEDQVRDFEHESARVPLPPPPNLGNFPDELDRPALPLRGEAPEPTGEPMPERAAPAPAPAPEREDGPDDERGDEPAREEPPDRMADLETRLAGVEREREFLKLALQGRQPAAPAAAQPHDPLAAIDAMLGGFRITADDWQAMQADPAKGAEYLQNGLRAAIAAGAALATQQLRGEFSQYVNGQQQGMQLRDMFYGEHPDLEPYARLVQLSAQDVRGEHPQIDAPTLVRETATRVRAQLKDWGVTPQARGGAATPARGAAPAGGTVTRIRPARSEMGGGHGGGRAALSPLEKQLRGFEAGVGYGR